MASTLKQVDVTGMENQAEVLVLPFFCLSRLSRAE